MSAPMGTSANVYFTKPECVSRYNRSGPRGAGNTGPGLTHSSDVTREGLAMNATRILPTRRRVSSDPHPDLAEAVTVSRFWRMVEMSAPTECWPWLGDSDRDGYGVFSYHGRIHRAPELALSFSVGEVRHQQLDTCHSCDNPTCCNPTHLRFDTRASNVRDMRERGRAVHVTKLTNSDVQLIRERRALGARQQDLADQFGVTNGQISMIVRGLRWTSAGGPIQPERTARNG